MSKSILITFNAYPQTPSAFLPDNGLASLAGSLLDAGHRTKIFDYNTPTTMQELYSETREQFYRNIKSYSKQIAKEILSQEGVDFVGFKLWTGDGFLGSMNVAKELKRMNKRLKIIAGGPHVPLFAENIFAKTDAFDILCLGEGEESIVGYAGFIDKRNDLENVPNLVYVNNRELRYTSEKRINNLERLATAVYDKNVYPIAGTEKKLNMLVSEWARGCPYQCNFCIHPGKSGNRTRSKSPDKIVDELVMYKEEYGTKVFVSGDSDTPGRLLEQVADELTRRRQKIVYNVMTHMNHVNRARLAKMKEAGFVSVFYGMESGSQEILDHSIDKKLKVETIRRAISATKEAGITVFASVIVPAPGETEETKRQTLELLTELKPDYVTVSIPMIGPHTKWHDESGRFNIKLGKNYDEKTMFFTPTLLFPANEGNMLEFEMDGKSFQQVISESSEFGRQVEAAGMVTQVSYDIALMSKYANSQPIPFRDRIRKVLRNGGHKEMTSIIGVINENMRIS